MSHEHDPPIHPDHLPKDELDALLRAWHQQNAAQAAAARDRILGQLRPSASPMPSSVPAAAASLSPAHAPEFSPPYQGGAGGGSPTVTDSRSARKPATSAQTHSRWRFVMTRCMPIAAVIALLVTLVPTILPTLERPVYGQDVTFVPEGGRLEALDSSGNLLGPCPLKGTDVDVAVSGPFARVTLTQKFHNPYADKIEAVYTFPMSHRAAVDRMTMTIGDRVILGEVKERRQARQIYESARKQGHVASLLEQERPNIFTQSVANIEPGAEIDVHISYVEMLESRDGTFSFAFPMTVEPRYIPGTPTSSLSMLPGALRSRTGLVLLGPAELKPSGADDAAHTALSAEQLDVLLRSARAIHSPADDSVQRPLWCRFEAVYGGGSKEVGELYNDGTGHVNGRWFYVSATQIERTVTGFAPNTNQVPDAGRITPMPVHPSTRAGHDISVNVTIDTGGPGILDVKSELHEIIRTKALPRDAAAPRRLTVQLRKEREIPNRDFVLTWKQTADTVQEATFTHTGKQGNFFTLMLQPPARTTDAQAVPRELVFVLDTSGSMSGLPIEKAKETMSKAIAALRPQDAFNLITFSGDTRILWEQPRPGTPENVAAAQQFLATRSGSGGTEMMKAIDAALVQAPAGQVAALTPDELANLPADGRQVIVRLRESDLTAVFQDGMAPSVVDIRLSGEQSFRARISNWMLHGRGSFEANGTRDVEMRGHWVTEDRQRLFKVEHATLGKKAETFAPMRVVCFMTDGAVGNDMAIIDAVKRNAKTTRVFSFGIGNSVNRYLLDGMAAAGRGEVEYVSLKGDADASVERFLKRIQTPVLTDIELVFSDGLRVTDLTGNAFRMGAGCGTGVSPVNDQSGTGVSPVNDQGGTGVSPVSNSDGPSAAACIPPVIDLFDVKPLIIHGRYSTPGRGTLTIRGRTAEGRYERKLDLDLPAIQPDHDVIATLWARSKVEELMNRNLAAAQKNQLPDALRQEVVQLGETFSILTQYTSFVAVERQRVTIGGEPRLVAVPIELPEGVSFEGIFGPAALGRIIQLSGVRPAQPQSRIAERPASEGEESTAQPGSAGEHENLSLKRAYSDRNKRGEPLEQSTQLLKEHKLNEAAASAIDSTKQEASDQMRALAAANRIERQREAAPTSAPPVSKSVIYWNIAANPEVEARLRVDFPEEHEWRRIAKREPFGAGAAGEPITLFDSDGVGDATDPNLIVNGGVDWLDDDGDYADLQMADVNGDGTGTLALIGNNLVVGGDGTWADMPSNQPGAANLTFNLQLGAPIVTGAANGVETINDVLYSPQSGGETGGGGRDNIWTYTRELDQPGRLSARFTPSTDAGSLAGMDAGYAQSSGGSGGMGGMGLAGGGTAGGGFGGGGGAPSGGRGSSSGRYGAPYSYSRYSVGSGSADHSAPTTAMFGLQYANAGEVAEILKKTLAGSQRRGPGTEETSTSVRADENSNTVFITNSDLETIKQFQKLVSMLDAPVDGHAPTTRPAIDSRAATRPAGDAATTRPAQVDPVDPAVRQLIGWLEAMKSAGRLEWARKARVPAHLALRIAELAAAGRIEDAGALAKALAEFDSDFRVGTQMRDVLADEKLTAEDRQTRMSALAEEAKQAFDPVIRDLKLARRLDKRLLVLAKAAEAPPGEGSPATRPAPEGLAEADGRLRVTVAARDTTPTTLTALRSAGLQIEATAAKARLIIGLSAPGRLADVALVDAVRRVEPTVLSK
jgi:hypothetical protein